MAAEKGHHEVVAVLVAYNADTTIKNKVLNFHNVCNNFITMDVPKFSTACFLTLLILNYMHYHIVHMDQKHIMWKLTQIALFHTYQVDMHNAYMAPLSTIEVMVLICTITSEFSCATY